ncbi:hypothetical protein PUN28_004517 [Cardiocondyla obscurior]|uniref:alpha-glucosidase n=2 Tax=Cardiocondyla obscurior TaxID=286306 RepID=A0AAW2GG94_9HYME
MLESQHRVLFLSLLLTVVLISGEITNQGWWKHTVFYQIYPRSFMDSDNDGVGDLQGITSKLDYFVESGVGAIWLSPINRSPMVDFGYDVADFKDIDEIFGKLIDFENLIEKAKKIGLKVILDLVPNHTSDEHYWFQMSLNRTGKYKDYYIWADGKKNNQPPNNWISVFGGPAWSFSKMRNQWYFHQFHERQPDLNYSNPYVQEEMREIITYWLRKGISGFRVDAVPHIFETNYTSDEPRSNEEGVTDTEYNYLIHTLTKDQPETYDLVKSWRKVLDEYASQYNTEEKIMMTEAYSSLENTIKYYKYGAQVPFNFNFIMNVTANSTPTDFKNIIEDWMNKMPEDGTPNWVMGNHDRNRTASRFPGRPDQMTMLAMVLPGVAVTYYGEEIGMVNMMNISWLDTQDPQACNAGEEKYLSRSRDPARTPFQWNCNKNAGFSEANKTWLPVHKNYEYLNLLLQQKNNDTHYNVYRNLTRLRKESEALKGSLKVDVLNKTVLCVTRKSSKEAVTLLINFSNEDEQVIDLAGLQHSLNSLTEYKETKVKLASVRSNIEPGQTVNINKFRLPPTVSVILFSNSSKYIVASLQTIIILLFSLAIFK